MSDAPHALIAGAGIGGLTAALCLARSGFRVSLFERAKLMEEIGAGLQISPNASAFLRDLGVLPQLAGAALAPDALLIRRASDGALLQTLPLKDAERRWGAPYLLVHRADLQKALLERIAQEQLITLATESELASFTATWKGVEAVTRNGPVTTSYSGDCLIGADGLRSMVRQKLSSLRPGAKAAPALPEKAKYVAWRSLIDAAQVAPAMRRPESTLWLGEKAHLVHYPLRNSTVINVVAIVEDSITIDWSADIWSQTGDTNEIQARFTPWHEDARTLIGAAREWRKWPLVDLDPLSEWTAGRVALMGDAAHPMLPFMAQGAAQAIEDAAMLGAILSPQSPIEPCLAAYAAARRPRANRVQAFSRRQGRIYHLGPPMAFFRDLALRKMGEAQLLAQYDWLYRMRPEVK
jgi:salicylate hydroxylase